MCPQTMADLAYRRDSLESTRNRNLHPSIAYGSRSLAGAHCDKLGALSLEHISLAVWGTRSCQLS